RDDEDRDAAFGIAAESDAVLRHAQPRRIELEADRLVEPPRRRPEIGYVLPVEIGADEDRGHDEDEQEPDERAPDRPPQPGPFGLRRPRRLAFAALARLAGLLPRGFVGARGGRGAGLRHRQIRRRIELHLRVGGRAFGKLEPGMAAGAAAYGAPARSERELIDHEPRGALGTGEYHRRAVV